MIVMNEEEKQEFSQEWDEAVKTLKDSKINLSKIEIMPISKEYKKE